MIQRPPRSTLSLHDALPISLNKISIDLSENEELELETAANLNSKLYADGGKLILTDKRLAFKAHDSFKNKVVEIPLRDRKSTRLNSSHVRISYAVFCLKKKK